jgi:hypothetical protein
LATHSTGNNLGAVNTEVQDGRITGEKYFDMLEHYFSAELTDCGLIGKYLWDLIFSQWWISSLLKVN